MRDLGRAQHASSEQLSALLDNRAEPDEQAFLAEHVQACVLCSSELADLRSVRSMLRAMPVYLPPRSFTIPVPAAAAAAVAATAPMPIPVPLGRRSVRTRLAPITRALSALAAVLCVVFFSADAMYTNVDSLKPLSETSGALQITAARAPTSTTARSIAETESAARPVAAAPERAVQPAAPAAASGARTSESGAFVTATAASRQEYPAAAAAAAPRSAAAPPPPAPTAAPQQPGAAPPAPVLAPGQQATVVALTATQTAFNPTPVTGGAPARDAATAPAPADGARAQAQSAPRIDDQSGMSPLRTASFIFAVIAAALLLASFGLARKDREGEQRQAGHFRS